MLARILGFWWELEGKITLAELFGHLKGHQSEKYAGYARLLFIGETPKYHTGLFLTTKDHKNFCELKQDGAVLKLNVREVEAGSSLIDFNFFVVHKTTGRGMYQHYHNSAHPKVFSRFCAKQYAALQAERRDAALAAAGDKISEKEREKIISEYGGPLTWEMLVRKENFDTLVKRLQKISAFEFNLNSVKAETEKKFRQFHGLSERIRHRVTFTRKTTLKERRDSILGVKGATENIGEALVYGEDTDGLDKVIALHENPDSFGSYDFDGLAKQMVFEPANFADSVFMKELITVADAHANVLERKTG